MTEDAELEGEHHEAVDKLEVESAAKSDPPMSYSASSAPEDKTNGDEQEALDEPERTPPVRLSTSMDTSEEEDRAGWDDEDEASEEGTGMMEPRAKNQLDSSDDESALEGEQWEDEDDAVGADQSKADWMVRDHSFKFGKDLK